MCCALIDMTRRTAVPLLVLLLALLACAGGGVEAYCPDGVRNAHGELQISCFRIVWHDSATAMLNTATVAKDASLNTFNEAVTTAASLNTAPATTAALASPPWLVVDQPSRVHEYSGMSSGVISWSIADAIEDGRRRVRRQQQQVARTAAAANKNNNVARRDASCGGLALCAAGNFFAPSPSLAAPSVLSSASSASSFFGIIGASAASVGATQASVPAFVAPFAGEVAVPAVSKPFFQVWVDHIGSFYHAERWWTRRRVVFDSRYDCLSADSYLNWSEYLPHACRRRLPL
jgi:hypothetical protein